MQRFMDSSSFVGSEVVFVFVADILRKKIQTCEVILK